LNVFSNFSFARISGPSCGLLQEREIFESTAAVAGHVVTPVYELPRQVTCGEVVVGEFVDLDRSGPLFTALRTLGTVRRPGSYRSHRGRSKPRRHGRVSRHQAVCEMVQQRVSVLRSLSHVVEELDYGLFIRVRGV